MVPGAERPQMVHALLVIQLGILVDDRLVRRLQLRPHLLVMPWGVRPRTAVVRASVVGTSMRHCLLNRRADAVQIVREMVGVQRSLHRHHAAANIHADRGRNDRTASWNYAANGRANAPMHIRHGRHPLVDERQLRDVPKLLARSVLKLTSAGERLWRPSHETKSFILTSCFTGVGQEQLRLRTPDRSLLPSCPAARRREPWRSLHRESPR